MITQEQYNVTKQKKRNINIIIKLLNKRQQVVDEISGVSVGDTSINIDGDSSARRNGSLSIYVKNSSFDVKEDGKVWLDKLVNIIVEIQDISTKEWIPTNMGTFLIDNPTRNYDATNNVLSFGLLDLMNLFNGYSGGNLTEEYVIPAESSIRTSFIAILKENGFSKYVIEDVVQSVPNEIRVQNSGTYFDLMENLVTIVPKYQMYFDVDGVFHYERIPINANESIVADDDLFKNILISFSNTTNFHNVKNSVKVIGKLHEVQNYGGDATMSGDTYKISLSGITSYGQLYKVGFTTKNSNGNPYISVNNLPAKKIINEDGSIPKMSGNIYYVLRYDRDNDRFLFLGEVEPVYHVKDKDPDSPFNIYKLGEIPITLVGGVYDYIYTTELAKERAEWELYHKTRMQEAVNLICVPIYGLDVNKAIEITLPNKNGDDVTYKYIINKITTTINVGGTQSISINRYYPFYIVD